jgi:hypothetical protein
MCPFPYYQIMRQSKDQRILRYEMVRLALGTRGQARRSEGVRTSTTSPYSTPGSTVTVCH